jgi:uncharacterized protein (DUF362 family)
MFDYTAKRSSSVNRRHFLKAGLATGAGALLAARFVRADEPFVKNSSPAASSGAVANSAAPSKVALTNGDDRTDNVFRALKSLEKEILDSIGNRRVVIKPNNVSPDNQLASSHSGALTAILEFLKSIGKLDNVIIAESSAFSPTMRGFENFGYTKLADKYHVKLVDLDTDKFQTVMVLNETDAKPRPIRVSSILANQRDNFIISSAMLKTHDQAVATLSIKNIVVGAPLKLSNGGNGRGGSDKPLIHGGGARGINLNLAMLAPLLHPSLSVIDGFEGMEGNGPVSGSKVDHRVCVVSTDYLAADTVGASLMGIDPADMGYLTYLAAAKAGESDLSKMEILGEPIAKLAKKYQLATSIQRQLQWKNPSRVAATS